MKLENLASEPKLIKVVIDDAKIVEEFGEEIEFHVFDKQPLDKFIQFANQKPGESDFPKLLAFCKEMILNEKGEPVVSDNKVLPTKVMIACVQKVVEQLGK
jgi:predicted RND superfamily exporter protein